MVPFPLFKSSLFRSSCWLLATFKFIFFVSPAAGQPKNIKQVWELEIKAWSFAKAGKVKNYEALFHNQYVGWPCGYPQPATKSTIGDWVRNIRDNQAKLTYDLKFESAEDYGKIVVIVYSTQIATEYPDGRTWGMPGRFKITHTWMRVKKSWIAIGGMCGLPESSIQ
ncbi:MAG TPA: hypothetical protein VI548_04395 [Chitinophagaceae bacterium]|nr:hypothetical protein [Chitinophagaceae bacterium]